jgi:hypothetical protein
VALPIGLGAGAALAGGIVVGQGYWEFAPKAGTMSEAEALEKIDGYTTLKAMAYKELEDLITAHYGAFLAKIEAIPEEKRSADSYLFTTLATGDRLEERDRLLTDLNEWQKKRELYCLELNNYRDKANGVENLLKNKEFLEKVEKSDPELKTLAKDILDPISILYLANPTKLYQDKLTSLHGWVKTWGLYIDEADNNFKFFCTFEDDVKALQEIKLQNTATFKKFAVNPLKTTTQKVDGFMKWGYAKAEDLKNIGGDELVKHANASKIALGIGAVVAGLGTGIVAYTLINKKQPTSQASKST